MKSSTLISLLFFILIGGIFGSIVAPLVSSPEPVITQPVNGVNPLVSDSPFVSPQITQKTYGDPVQISIPTIGITAVIEQVGLDNQNRMAVPKVDSHIGWYSLGVKPGEVGSAVFAGHLDTRTGKPGVFFRLDELQIGDDINVLDSQGNTLVFTVTKTAKYQDNAFPIQEVFEQYDTSRLNLITCSGTFNRQARSYTDRTVVFSQLKTASP